MSSIAISPTISFSSMSKALVELVLVRLRELQYFSTHGKASAQVMGNEVKLGACMSHPGVEEHDVVLQGHLYHAKQ